ncbi:related to SKN7 - transcription factor [Ustilago sp. UG-2017b]|nr:related to SKN7 - transcription factor [Ustilago sp. UG-2017b]
MSNHPHWHDQQAQYSGQPQSRHHPNMGPYAGPSLSLQQQGTPYSNVPQHGGQYPQAHLPPSVSRQPPQQQQWTPSGGGGSEDYGGPSPGNSSGARSSAPYASGFDGGNPSVGNTNSPMRQHGTHPSPYASTSPYPPPPSDSQMHLGTSGGLPSQYDYNNNHGPGPGAYSHPHHPLSQSQQQQHPPPQHGHPSQQQQHWNSSPLPSVLQPQSMGPASGLGGLNRGPGGPSGLPGLPPQHAMDRAYGVPKQEDDIDDDDGGPYDDYDAKGKARGSDAAQTANKGTSDFVKKLFSMLDDKAYESVVAWSPSGDSFIVKDMNDFTKHVLPRNFRHSNFASFVRQLNKYDFHKVKNPEDGSGTVGEHVWEFQHAHFVRGREDLLENVKRKIPAKKKPNVKGGLLEADQDDSPSIPLPVEAAGDRSAESNADLRAQVANLTAVQDHMQNHILALTKQYQSVIGEMLTFQRNMVQQDQLMQNLIQYLMSLEQDRKPHGISTATFSPQNHGSGANASNDGSSFMAPDMPDKLARSFRDVSGSRFGQMNRGDESGSSNSNNNNLKATQGPCSVGSSGPGASSSTNAGSSTRLSGMTSAPSTAAPLSPKSVASPMDGNTGRTPESSQQLTSMTMQPPPRLGGSEAANNSLANANGPGDTRPKLDARNGSSNSAPGSFDSSNQNKENSLAPMDKKRSQSGPANLLRVRRNTFVPGWTVPPRVLLVDDDEVCRRLSSKFLQVFGCSIDYAVDGMSAVNKMNQEKYDLVLMDIVMPNLDGASATSLIRQFDPKTPIISMTSNSGPSELISYMSSGMTDILPKPFTKEGLLNMLEKHLLHLKTVQQQHRGSGLGDGSEEGLHQALNMSIKQISPTPAPSGGAGHPAGSTPSNGAMSSGAAGGDGSLNPLAGMGFTDEEYVAMLQNLIAAGTGNDDDLFGMGPLCSASDDATPGGRCSFGATPTPGLKRTASGNDGQQQYYDQGQQHGNGNGMRNQLDGNKRRRYNEIS